MPSLHRIRRLTLACAAGLALCTSSAHAILGETLSDMRSRLGRGHATERKHVHMWFFEVIDGQLSYTVTFNAQDRSIAEGIKPIKRARFTPDLARDFIATQTKPFANSKTLREVAAGEKYTFAGREFTCNEHEAVTVDDANGLLIVWTKAPIPSIMAVSHEMLGYTPPAK